MRRTAGDERQGKVYGGIVVWPIVDLPCVDKLGGPAAVLTCSMRLLLECIDARGHVMTYVLRA